MNTKISIFLSGGFRSGWQATLLERYDDRFQFFNPREHHIAEPNLYASWDIHYVRKCDIFFAYMEASNPSGFGLMFELGMAYALNKTIILVDERSEVDATFAKYFKIAHQPSGNVFKTLDEALQFLDKFI
jgi:nucleoside 2-deoxyribosyltransferase